jgi:protoheme IX farnesyltransferase
LRCLKRYTSQNIVIGGLAGALPPLIGWMSISCDDLFLPLWMTALIFIWTPSHFWALCLIRSDDYKAVGVPMLPVTHGAQYTIFQVMIYSISLFCLSLLPYYYDALSHFYFYCALFLGLIYVVLSVLIFSAYKSRVDKLNMRCGLLFAYSILYLFVLFAVIFFDRWYYFNEF